MPALMKTFLSQQSFIQNAPVILLKKKKIKYFNLAGENNGRQVKKAIARNRGLHQTQETDIPSWHRLLREVP